ncbi:MAG: GFA family protein [Gammaproteobacteria bacterium]
MSGQTVTGSCLCGAVRYELQGPFSHMGHCHCSICRKHHGAAFATYVACPLDGLRFLSGEDHQGRYDSSPGWSRPFCLTCGSVLPTRMPEHGLVVGPAGNLEGELGVEPAMHMFVGSKAPWYEITDALPRHDAYPPEGGMTEVRGPAPEPTSPGWTSGSCACGKVAFEFEGVPLRMLNCHCSRCRRGRSAAHATNLFVALDKFHFRRGEDLVRQFHLPGARYFGVAFCSACGSDVVRKSLERHAAVIPAGSLDSDPGMRASAHIFVGSKASWFEITDGLPQFQAMPA